MFWGVHVEKNQNGMNAVAIVNDVIIAVRLFAAWLLLANQCLLIIK